jgi:hypothetical protein
MQRHVGNRLALVRALRLTLSALKHLRTAVRPIDNKLTGRVPWD